MFTEKQFYDQFKEFVARVMKEVPVFATQLGDHRYDHLLGHFDKGSLDRQLAGLKADLVNFEAIDSNDFSTDGRIDHTIAIQTLKFFIRDSEEVRTEYRNPGTYLSQCLAGVYLLIAREFAPLPERLKSVLERMKEIPRVLNEGKDNIVTKEVPPLWAKMTLESAKMASGLFAGLIPSLASQAPDITDDLNEAAQIAAAAVQDYAIWIENDVIPNSEGDFKDGKAMFETRLRENHMVDWDSDWLLKKGNELYDSTLAEMEALAKQIDPDKSTKELVEEMKNNHPTAEELLDTYRSMMESARQFVIDKDLATIPKDEQLKIEETPAFLRNQIPYAAYLPPGLLDEEQQGIFIVTPIDPNAPPEAQEEKLRGHSMDEMPRRALHEAYPGHHLQLVVANKNATLARLFGRFLSTLFIEGWAFYCEGMMEEQGFLNKPLEKLGRLQAQLWRAARIIVDVSLHTGKMSHEEAVKFMVEKANLEPSDAEAEVNRYTQNPTQPMSYLMGKYEIVQIVDEYKKKFPDHSLKQMHDAILNCGSLPPRLMRQRLFA